MAGQRPKGTGGSDPIAGATHRPPAPTDDCMVVAVPDRRDRRAARTGLALWVGALVVGIASFHAIGDGPLAAPPIDPAGWLAWAEGRDPLVATFAVLRLLVLALSWYLVGATSIGILARALRAASLIRLADALTVPALRRVLQTALGVSLATAMVASSVPASAPAARETSAVDLRTAGDDAVAAVGSSVEVTLAALGEEDQITLEHVEDDARPFSLSLLDRARAAEAAADGRTATESAASEPADTAGGESRGTPRPPSITAAEHVVVAGESFWTIADEVLTDRLDRTPTEAETAAYWERLVLANRDRLVDRDNPDLIFPGQSLSVPPSGTGASTAETRP
jgi:hypothetical protein